MGDLSKTVVDLALEGLDLLVYLDSLLSSVVDLLLQALQFTLQVSNYFVLFPDAVLMISHALTHLSLDSAGASLQIADCLLKGLVVPLAGLVVLDLVSVGLDDTVASVLGSWLRNLNWGVEDWGWPNV